MYTPYMIYIANRPREPSAGVLLRSGFSAQRRKRLFRDQHGDRRSFHENRFRPRKARRVRSGGGGQRRSSVRQTQQRRRTELR